MLCCMRSCLCANVHLVIQRDCSAVTASLFTHCRCLYSFCQCKDQQSNQTAHTTHSKPIQALKKLQYKNTHQPQRNNNYSPDNSFKMNFFTILKPISRLKFKFPKHKQAPPSRSKRRVRHPTESILNHSRPSSHPHPTSPAHQDPPPLFERILAHQPPAHPKDSIPAHSTSMSTHFQTIESPHLSPYPNA